MTKSKDLPRALSAKKAAEFAGLFLWICPAEEILHESDLPMPHRGKFNYLDVLIQQCELRKESAMPVFFGYMGSMLTKQQKSRMEGLNDSVPNLITVDLDSKEFQSVIDPGDDVARALNKEVLCARDQFRAKKGQAELVRHRSSYISDALGSIQYLVDYARIFCVTCSDILLKYAEQKFPEEGHKTPFIERNKYY